MPTRSPIVLLLGTRYPDLAIEREVLGAVGAELVVAEGGEPGEIVDAARHADVIIAGSRPRLDRAVIEKLDVKGIVRAGIGVDSVDLDAARRGGIWVANVPDYGTEAVAFHTLALIVTGLRRIVEADRSVRGGEWAMAGLRPLFLPRSLTFGVVGFGRIGRRVAELVGAVGATRILVADPFADPAAEGVEVVQLGDLLGRADVVTLHAPGGPDGPLLGADHLAAMRPGSLLVNTARGSLIELAALSRGLAEGRPGLALLDVFPTEPPDVSVLEPVGDRVVLTPHMAWYTEESQEALRRSSAEEARRIILGQTPSHVIVGPETTTGGMT